MILALFPAAHPPTAWSTSGWETVVDERVPAPPKQ
jgi:hypothetical protein